MLVCVLLDLTVTCVMFGDVVGTVAAAESTALTNKWNAFVYCGSIAYFKAGDVSSIVNAKVAKSGCTLYVYQ